MKSSEDGNCSILYNKIHNNVDSFNKIVKEDINSLTLRDGGDVRGQLAQYWFTDFYDKMSKKTSDEYLKRLVASNMKLNLENSLEEDIKIFNNNFKKLLDDEDIKKKILKKLFESEKASIVAMIMQTDPNLNNALDNFILELIDITKEGIEYCKKLDNENNLIGEEIDDETVIFLLNRGMPIIDTNNKSDNIHVFPGSFIIKEEHLSKEGLNTLNFREKSQLMNCFWNCSSHFKERVNDVEFFKEGKTKGKKFRYLKQNEQYPPPLNLIYEKISKNKEVDIDQYQKLRIFIDRVQIFQDNFYKLTETNEREKPANHVIPSAKFPICFDYNLSKTRWNKLIEQIKEQEEYPIVLTDDFLHNISRINKLKMDISLSDNEKEFMENYENTKNKEGKSKNVIKGGVYWSSGFSLYQLNPESIIEFNRIELEAAKNDAERIKDLNTGEIYTFTRSSLSGSTWKYLQLAYFCGIRDLDSVYMIAIAYMVGCFHHSWYEVTQSAIDFKNEMNDNNINIYPQDNSNPYNLNVTDKYWKINQFNPLFQKKNVLDQTLTQETKTIIRKEFITGRSRESVRDGDPGKNYLHFYRKYLLPLLPLEIDKYNCGDILSILKTEESEMTSKEESSKKIDMEEVSIGPRRSRRVQERTKRGGKRKKRKTKKIKKKVRFIKGLLYKTKKMKIIKKGRRTTRKIR